MLLIRTLSLLFIEPCLSATLQNLVLSLCYSQNIVLSLWYSKNFVFSVCYSQNLVLSRLQATLQNFVLSLCSSPEPRLVPLLLPEPCFVLSLCYSQDLVLSVLLPEPCFVSSLCYSQDLVLSSLCYSKTLSCFVSLLLSITLPRLSATPRFLFCLACLLLPGPCLVSLLLPGPCLVSLLLPEPYLVQEREKPNCKTLAIWSLGRAGNGQYPQLQNPDHKIE